MSIRVTDIPAWGDKAERFHRCHKWHQSKRMVSDVTSSISEPAKVDNAQSIGLTGKIA